MPKRLKDIPRTFLRKLRALNLAPEKLVTKFIKQIFVGFPPSVKYSLVYNMYL